MAIMSIERDGDTPRCRVSVVVNRATPGALGPLVSLWPEMDGWIDDASDVDHEQYEPPRELLLLPEEKQTPPEIQDIVLSSLKGSDEVELRSEEPKASQDPTANSKGVEDTESSVLSQCRPLGSPSDRTHSSSASTNSLSLSTSRTTNSSNESARHTPPKKAKFSALLLSTTNLIGSVKHAIKDSSTTEKNSRSIISQEQAGTESECASCFDDLPVRRMYNLKCEHSYCPACFTTLIITAMGTESMFPPKCCLTEIPMKDILASLDKAQKELYKAKGAELSLKPENRWYCPNSECAKWIPPSKLHRLRILGAKCPSCNTGVCGYCRGMIHGAGVDCPEDFGLEATLEEAERQGWRRCYKCRTLVELTAGCRHITCKCGAQFCYTCGAKWRTCSCSEADQQRRQTEIATRRNARNTRSREEEEEIAQAIFAFEEMERREEQERARETAERETREALLRIIQATEQRRREHLERLEAEKKRLENEEAARRREGAIRSSIIERINYLRGALLDIQQFQQSSLISSHKSEAATLDEDTQTQQAIHKTELDTLQIKLNSNSILRHTFLQSAYTTALAKLTSTHETAEDDTFISMQEHLRGKPNREIRLQTAMDRLQLRHKAEMDSLVHEHDAKTKRLTEMVAIEHTALQSGYDLQSSDHASRSNEASTLLNKTMLAERKWFELIAHRRQIMMEELQSQLWRSSGIDQGSNRAS